MKISARSIIYALVAFATFISVACVSSCHKIEEWDDNAQGNFDALWTLIDRHYCFFQDKDIDWKEVYDRYHKRLYPGMSSHMLFGLCSEMVNELKDGHVNLSASFNTSYYRNWWSDYPQNYDERIIQQNYLGFDYKSLGSIYYSVLRQNIGYIRYPSFSSSLGEGNIDAILLDLYLCNGLIIDIRNNGGGELTNAETLIKRFLTERTLAGYMINKTGPGHNDFSDPTPYYFEPAGDGHQMWSKPVVVLTNRSTFSAANNFVSIMQYLPNVKIAGARTGGGSGMPVSFELPNGWAIRMSTVSVLDPKGKVTEYGIDPSPGCEVDLDPVAALRGIDTMLEKAIEIASGQNF